MSRRNKMVISRVQQPIYQNSFLSASQSFPEFKPGKSLSYQYGNELLNGKVNWQETALSILEAGYSKVQFAKEMKLSVNDIEKMCDGDLSPLDFKLGARMLTLQCSLHSCLKNR